MINRAHKDITQMVDDIDIMFIKAVIGEVTESCAIPFAIPMERIPKLIRQAAMYFWQTDDLSVENRMYVIRNVDICRDAMGANKIVQLPQQVVSVYGCHKTKQSLGRMGDFSIERMMMSSYSMFGGVGNSTGTGLSFGGSSTGWTLTDAVAAMFEVSTFEQALCPPLSYDYNTYSKKLVILGDLGSSDLLIQCYIRCKIQDLYNNIYFFKKVVALVKKSLHNILGGYEFNLPGGIKINYERFKEDAEKEEEEIKEYIEQNRSMEFIMMPNTI